MAVKTYLQRDGGGRGTGEPRTGDQEHNACARRCNLLRFHRGVGQGEKDAVDCNGRQDKVIEIGADDNAPAAGKAAGSAGVSGDGMGQQNALALGRLLWLGTYFTQKRRMTFS